MNKIEYNKNGKRYEVISQDMNTKEEKIEFQTIWKEPAYKIKKNFTKYNREMLGIMPQKWYRVECYYEHSSLE